jgi:putative DNA primase/helicase
MVLAEKARGMLDVALHYAKQGWPVFPLTIGGKEPLKGSHGFQDATLDLNRIEVWWQQSPDSNIGIATGRRSGVLVIDVDPRKCAKCLESLHQLALPETFTVRTWSGGWHLYFTLPAESKITIGADLLPGVDWRANGGYVVAPGSIVNGALYTIAKNLPIAAAPTQLLERIEAHRKHRRIERDATGHMVLAIGRRNDTLMRIACAIRRWGIEYNAMFEALRAINADHCDPALTDEELRAIAASVSRYAPADEVRS